MAMVRKTYCCLACTLLLALILSATGCSRSAQRRAAVERSSRANPAELAAAGKARAGPASQTTSQQLDPLTTSDVKLYLDVMRAAAARWNNLPAGDKAVFEQAKRVTAGTKSGTVPSPSDLDALSRSTMMLVDLDEVVAEEKKVDLKKYRGIREAVDAVVSNPALALASGGGDEEGGGLTHQPTALETRLKQVNETNEKTLAPDKAEIQQLLGVVRNPMHMAE